MIFREIQSRLYFFSFFYQDIKGQLLNTLKQNLTSTPTRQILKLLTSILSNLNNFHSLEVVDRISETQLQMNEITIK